MNENKVKATVAVRLAFLALSLQVMLASTRSFIPISIPDDTQATAPVNQPVSQSRDKVHVLYALSGNSSGFLAEFEVSMKSALMNSPIDLDMAIHIMADEEAYQALPEVLNRTEIATWKTRNQISVVVYNIQSKLKAWARVMKTKTCGN